MNDRLSFAAATLCRPLVAMIAIVAVTSHSPAQQSTSDTQLKAQLKRLPAEKWRQPPQGAEPELVYSPWAKFCLTGQEPNARKVCFTGKDGRHEGGPVVAIVLIEPENEPKKVLRITLPLGMSIQPGTRVIVDNDQPMTGPYVACFNNGCMADYEASSELIGKLKKGKRVVIQGSTMPGSPSASWFRSRASPRPMTVQRAIRGHSRRSKKNHASGATILCNPTCVRGSIETCRVGKIAYPIFSTWARRVRDFAHASRPSGAPLPTLRDFMRG